MLAAIATGFRISVLEIMSEQEVLLDGLLGGNKVVISEIFENPIIDAMNRLIDNLHGGKEGVSEKLDRKFK
jgi:hypothetical protein